MGSRVQGGGGKGGGLGGLMVPVRVSSAGAWDGVGNCQGVEMTWPLFSAQRAPRIIQTTRRHQEMGRHKRRCGGSMRERDMRPGTRDMTLLSTDRHRSEGQVRQGGVGVVLGHGGERRNLERSTQRGLQGR